MEKETYTHVKISEDELKRIIAKELGVSVSQIDSLDYFEVPCGSYGDDFEFGGLKLTYHHITP